MRPLTSSTLEKRELPSNHKGVEKNGFPTKSKVITKQRVTKLKPLCRTIFFPGWVGRGTAVRKQATFALPEDTKVVQIIKCELQAFKVERVVRNRTFIYKGLTVT